MHLKVHVVTKSGKINENNFSAQNDAINFARQRSIDNLCAIVQTDKALTFYEHGDLVTDADSKRYLTELIQEIGAREAYQAVYDGKKSLGK